MALTTVLLLTDNFLNVFKRSISLSSHSLWNLDLQFLEHLYFFPTFPLFLHAAILSLCYPTVKGKKISKSPEMHLHFGSFSWHMFLTGWHCTHCKKKWQTRLSAHTQSLNLQQNISLSTEWRLMCTCRMKGSHATSHKPLFTSWATPLTATPCSNIHPISLSTMTYWTACTGLNKSRPYTQHIRSKTAHKTFPLQDWSEGEEDF